MQLKQVLQVVALTPGAPVGTNQLGTGLSWYPAVIGYTVSQTTDTALAAEAWRVLQCGSSTTSMKDGVLQCSGGRPAA
jgi:hypothetical protein